MITYEFKFWVRGAIPRTQGQFCSPPSTCALGHAAQCTFKGARSAPPPSCTSPAPSARPPRALERARATRAQPHHHHAHTYMYSTGFPYCITISSAQAMESVPDCSTGTEI